MGAAASFSKQLELSDDITVMVELLNKLKDDIAEYDHDMIDNELQKSFRNHNFIMSRFTSRTKSQLSRMFEYLHDGSHETYSQKMKGHTHPEEQYSREKKVKLPTLKKSIGKMSKEMYYIQNESKDIDNADFVYEVSSLYLGFPALKLTFCLYNTVAWQW